MIKASICAGLVRFSILDLHWALVVTRESAWILGQRGERPPNSDGVGGRKFQRPKPSSFCRSINDPF